MSEKHGTRYPEIFDALAEDFDPNQVRSKTLGGRQCWYITARTVMNRLDKVLGPENWWDRYKPVGNAIVCALTIRLPDGEKITKFDAGGAAGMQDEGDDEKSAYSDAFKRAAVKFGVGRILYGDGVPDYQIPVTQPAKITSPPKAQSGPRKASTSKPEPEFRDGKVRPGEASIGGGVAPPIKGRVGNAVNGLKSHANGSAHGVVTAVLDGPRNAHEFYEFVKSLDPQGNEGIRSHLATWGRGLGFPALIKKWSDSQATRGYDELVSFLELRKED